MPIPLQWNLCSSQIIPLLRVGTFRRALISQILWFSFFKDPNKSVPTVEVNLMKIAIMNGRDLYIL